MKYLILIVFTILTTSILATGSSKRANLKTNINLESKYIDGKYRIPEENQITVENSKALDNLIGPPRDFNNRLQRMKARQ
jgi:hypothetical protein